MPRGGYVDEEDEAQKAADQLGAWDASTRRFALQSLALLGAKAAEHGEEVAKLLEDEEPEVRKCAAAGLGRLGNCKRSAGSLAAALKDAEPAVRVEALNALGRLEAARGHLPQILALAKDQDVEAGCAAVKCLAALGEAKELPVFMEGTLPEVVRAAVLEVGRCPEARRKGACLVKVLQHKEASVRLAAAQACGELGEHCSEAHLSELGSLAQDPQAKVRRAAVQALGRVGGARYIPAFFLDKEEAIRHFAAETAGTGDQAAAEACVQELSGAAARWALLALGRMTAGRSWAKEVADCIASSDFATRLAAIQALSDLGAEEQAERLKELSLDQSKGVRQAAVCALAKMGARGAEFAVNFLDDEDPAVRQSAVKVYSPLHSKLKAHLAKPYAASVARKLLDEDWRVRLAAVVALGDLKASFAEQVGALCRDPDNQVRRSALAALEKMGAAPALAAGFLGDDDAAVRKDAATVYAALGGGQMDDGELSEAD